MSSIEIRKIGITKLDTIKAIGESTLLEIVGDTLKPEKS